MTPERWQAIQDLLLATLERPEARRADFLADACAGDEDLRGEIQSLLLAHATEGPADRLADTLGGRLITELIEGGSLEGESVGRYEVGERLGQGGMSVVYRAWDPKLERYVALKCLPGLVSSDRASRHRLLAEAQMAAGLEHRNICTIHEIEEAEDGRLFIAMPLYDGETLRTRLESGPLAEKETLRLALQAALGLSKAHERGIIHRDIKPGNLVITGDGTLKILDFGIAQPEGAHDTRGGTAGTAHYMAPEQVAGGRADARSDLWSLGVVLYEALAGRRPFEGKTREEVRHAVAHDEPVPLEEILPDVSEPLAHLIETLLRKDPSRRPESAAEVVQALRRAQRGAREPSRRRMFGAVAAILVVAAVVVAGGSGLWSVQAPGGRDVRRVAVLPLTNLSDDPEQDDLAATMTSQLIGQLAQLRGLLVISYAAVLPYADRSQPMQKIAEELNVDAVIDGFVARSGDEVRVTAELIDGDTQAQLWMREYTRDVRALRALENEVAREIARQVDVSLSPEEESRLSASRPVSPEAQEAFLQGVYLQRRYQAEEGPNDTVLTQSIEALGRAVELEPDWAEAHAELARAYHWLASGPPKPRQAEYYLKAKAAAQTAIELDETLAGGHAALAFVLDQFERDWRGAEREYRRALELAPNDNYYRWGWAMFESRAGRYDDAVADFRWALEQAPVSPSLHHQLVRALGCAGRYGEARALLEGDDEDDPMTLAYLGSFALREGAEQEGVVLLERALERSDSSSVALSLLAFAYGSVGREREARALIPELEARDVWIPEVYAAIGESERALDELEWGYDHDYRPLLRIGCWPGAAFTDVTTMEGLAGQPRLGELLRKIDFPPSP
jgi:TolB-like protein